MLFEHGNRIAAYGPMIDGAATHYGEQFNGLPLGCGGIYSSYDLTIVAVGYDLTEAMPCGTLLLICGSSGCLVGMRQDTCPGCEGAHIDLSESGIDIACGAGSSWCPLRIQALEILPAAPPPPPPAAVAPPPIGP
jgi:hypothetical protein